MLSDALRTTQRMLMEMLDRIDARLMRLDMVVSSDVDGCRVFWPISRKARKVVPHVLSRYPRRRLGYAVPDRHWKVEYDTLRDQGCDHVGTFMYL